MKFSRTLAASLALSLVAAPVAAQTSDSSSSDDGWLAEGGVEQLAALIGVAAAIIIAITLFDDEDPISA